MLLFDMRRPAYITNKELLIEIKKSHENGLVTDRLGQMLMLLAQRYSNRPNWRGYSFIDTMRDEAICGMIAAVPKFNPERSSNPFAYLTTVTTNCFRRVWAKEQKQASIRDDLLERAGLTPSWTRQQYNEDNKSSEPIPIRKKPGPKHA